MRKLLLLRGAPGSGKTKLLRDTLGMGHNVLSADEMRLTMSSPVMMPDGRMGVEQALDHRVIPMMRAIFRERAGRGETLAVDMVFERKDTVDLFVDVARESLYRTLVVDFGDKPLADCLAWNEARDPVRHVPRAIVERMHASIAANPLAASEDVDVVRWDPKGEYLAAVRGFLDVPTVDLSRFRAVVHVGDLQGCHTVLAGPGGPLERGLDPDVAYVFVGDLLDRGIENDRVFGWFIENCLGRDNCFLLHGNHEDHIVRWGMGLAPVSAEFSERTLPQLLKAGFTPSDGLAVARMAREVLPYEWRGQKVLVTHAGMPTVPASPGMVSLQQYSAGVGRYEEPVDATFDRIAPEGWVQVHGHRNQAELPVRASPRSFNLEARIEFGGHLAMATLDERGWTTSRHRNAVFAPAADRRNNKDKTAAPWVGRADGGPTISAASVTALRAHAGVRAKRAGQAFPNVESFAFTKDVFFDKSWDDVVVKARGLFVDTRNPVRGPDGEERFRIASRGYPKFFNTGERPETDPKTWAEAASYPVSAYLKENGFLGNLGVDPASGDLFVASKSTADGPFAEWFGDILSRTLSPEHLDRVRRWLVDNDACMTFEVIDPVRDPHIVEYDSERLVLLDVFRRSEEMERLPYDHLKMVGEKLGLEVKQKVAFFRDARALLGFMAKMSGPGATIRGQMVEGLVFEGQDGGMVKLKMADYAFWKRMRSAKDRLEASRKVSGRRGSGRFDTTRYAEDPRAEGFLDWLQEQDDETVAGDIISLRKAYLARDVSPDAAEDEEPVGPRP